MHNVDKRIARNDATMANTLPPSKEVQSWAWCHRKQEAARARRGVKRGTAATRRRSERQRLRESLDTYFEST